MFGRFETLVATTGVRVAANVDDLVDEVMTLEGGDGTSLNETGSRLVAESLLLSALLLLEAANKCSSA